MEFVFDDAGTMRAFELEVIDPTVRVADLAAALGVAETALVIDGRLVAGDVGLRASNLVCGSTVAAVDPAARTCQRPAPMEARVVGGLDAGARIPLHTGENSVGRDADADVVIDNPAVSRKHARIEVVDPKTVRVTDLGSRNGIDVNGVLIGEPTSIGPDETVGVAGAALLRVVPVPDAQQRAAVDTLHGMRHGWRIPFQRQARRSAPAPAPLAVPAAPERSHRSAILYTSLLVPLGLAAVTVVLFQDLRFAAFALLSPTGYFASMAEDRLRGRRGRRRGQRAYLSETRRFARDLCQRRLAEVRRRRAAAVDLAEAGFRATAPGARLWERRVTAPDFLTVTVATGDEPWQPDLVRDNNTDELPGEIAALLAAESELPRVPVSVDLAAVGVLGVEGSRKAALAAARAVLCQAAVTVGPADLAIAVFTHSAWAAQWEWTKWLPHVLDRSQSTTRLIAVGRGQADALAADLLANHPFPDPDRGALLVVVDGAVLLEGRNCPLRDLLARRSAATTAVILADPLPALCEAVLTVRPSGSGQLRLVSSGQRRDRLLVTGQSEHRAAGLARSLARFEDPEIALAGAGLPAETPLLPLLDLPEFETDVLARRWSAGAAALRARTVLGVTETGRSEIDLDDDGPHGLIAGTTGSGKSELLRSLVAGLAIGNDPDHLVFVLIDYKGGGALDECARLPHVVGLVTDLDEQLSRRALRCLEAELRHRERALRAARVSDFRTYQRLRDKQSGGLAPMPRMVVVIDEFATLAKALPTFVDALVDVAQRGRSLGVHLIMATQRPAGSVSDAIKANVKLRIALRLETREDSLDVIDSPAAAGIGPRQWGRAFRRIGGGEAEAVQTALASTVTDTGGMADRLRLRPFSVTGQSAVDAEPAEPDSAPTDLNRLVDLARATFVAGEFAVPRSPWPAPLPGFVAWEDNLAPAEAGLQTSTAGLPAVVLADDPDAQRQLALGWDPDVGNLLVFGAVGSGTTTALGSVVLAWTRAVAPERLRVYVLDHGGGELAALADLPHTGGYVRTDDRERLVRLVGLLSKELKRRKNIRLSTVDRQRWLVAVDGLGSLLTGSAATDDPVVAGLMDVLAEVYAEGAAVGISFVGSADRAGGIPGTWLSRTAQRLLLPLADTGDYGSFGLSTRDVPAAAPGRAIVPATRQVVQVIAPRDGLPAAVTAVCATWPDSPRSPRIEVLPPVVRLTDVSVTASAASHPWTLPVGVAQETLDPVALTVHEHDHVLITGPRRSGRSTLLCTIATGLLAAAEAPVFGYAPRNSPLRRLLPPERLAADVDALTAAVRENDLAPVVLVDDADTFDDLSGLFLALSSHEDPGLHVIAVARNDGPVRAGSHWLSLVRRARCGVLLMPEFLDGDLLGAALPRRAALPDAPGRGYLVSDGSFVAVQVAVPCEHMTARTIPARVRGQ